MGNITYGKSKTVHSGNHTYNHTYDMNDSTEESFCCCCFSLPKNEVNCLLLVRSTACGETPCGNIHIRGLGPGKQISQGYNCYKNIGSSFAELVTPGKSIDTLWQYIYPWVRAR